MQSCSNGIFAIAQPDAVVISVFKVHIIPDGDAPLDLSAKIEYAFFYFHDGCWCIQLVSQSSKITQAEYSDRKIARYDSYSKK